MNIFHHIQVPPIEMLELVPPQTYLNLLPGKKKGMQMEAWQDIVIDSRTNDENRNDIKSCFCHNCEQYLFNPVHTYIVKNEVRCHYIVSRDQMEKLCDFG